MQVVKKRPGWVVAAVCAAVIIIGYLWYTRPMTLEQLCPDFSLEECRAIRGYYSSSLEFPSQKEFTLSPEDPASASLLEQFRDRTFRRSLPGLLFRGTRTHTGSGYTWDVFFEFDDVTLSDGSVNSGTLLYIHNFYGTVDIDFAFGGSWRQVSTAGKSQWVSDVYGIISGTGG